MKYSKLKILPLLFVLLFIGNYENVVAQYAPPAGQTGSNAIHADSSIFIQWATVCTVDRGYADISNANLGLVSYGNDEAGVGKADNVVVSLGDGGSAVLNFDVPISDGDGWDFAVFENSFLDDFLELAFVEVSSNGIDYYRFNSVSLTQQDTQTATFGLTDAAKLYNLAGKYKALYGTPFDLNELKNIPALDISNIISIRIIDVVGCINEDFATYDSLGNIINDPWPTPFESGGFDIDAIGVINNRDNTFVNETIKNSKGIISPTPSCGWFNINIEKEVNHIVILNLNGKFVTEITTPHKNHINIDYLPVGFYIIKIYTDDKIITTKLIKR